MTMVEEILVYISPGAYHNGQIVVCTFVYYVMEQVLLKRLWMLCAIGETLDAQVLHTGNLIWSIKSIEYSTWMGWYSTRAGVGQGPFLFLLSCLGALATTHASGLFEETTHAAVWGVHRFPHIQSTLSTLKQWTSPVSCSVASRPIKCY